MPKLPPVLPVFLIVCLLTGSVSAASDETAPQAESIRLAIEDLHERFPDAYPQASEYLARLATIEAVSVDAQRTAALRALRREALLANPLLDFDRILLIRRSMQGNRRGLRTESPALGLPQNWQSNSSLGRDAWDNEIVFLEGFREESPTLRTLYAPGRDVLVKELDLHWDAQRLLFSSIDEDDIWHVYEIGTDGSGLRQVTPDSLQGDNYDACYLPDDKIVFASTVIEQCVPCTGGGDPIANLFRISADGTGIRRLCFDQDQNWHPVVTEQGTVLYTRWQYSDQAHFFPRIVMQMNPDGTSQREHYGSGSYWPTSLFFVRPIPGNPNRFIGIVSGHHGVPRMGELVLFDVRLGRRENIEHTGRPAGVVQRIPERGKEVRAKIEDRLVDCSWPKFLYPFPLDAKYFLVSAQPTQDSSWGIYLVDVFDNMVLLCEEPGRVLFEPMPVRPTERPPVIPDRARPDCLEATVYISDIYRGPGLQGVPRGTVKALQLYTFNFPVRGGHKGHSLYSIGISGPWDLHTVLGRVPVEADGSAHFQIPANTPISLQPLDAEGKAVQVMRSWFTAMPGENVSCVGCHEQQDATPLSVTPSAFFRSPSEIEPWLGAARTFDFNREVQLVLDRSCVGCHDGSGRSDAPDLRALPLQASERLQPTRLVTPDSFSRAYYHLQRYVNRPGPESEMATLMPMEHHADTSELVQMLQKDHYGVRLSQDDWDRLVIWIDLNAPYYGSWIDASPGNGEEVAERLERRREAMLRYANQDWPLAEMSGSPSAPVSFVSPAETSSETLPTPELEGWPLSDELATRLQESTGPAVRRKVTFGDRGEMTMLWIPPGSFVMGSLNSTPDELPLTIVEIEEGFWMSETEVTNQQFAQFAPDHHSRYFSVMKMNTSTPRDLLTMNHWYQPVARVSWNQAHDFCQWLSQQTGKSFNLPTEAQWEWACRAGSNREFPDVSEEEQAETANCAGASFGAFHDCNTLTHRLFDEDWDDGVIATEPAGANVASAWGLYNMHGNVAEWTRSLYKSYPYRADDGRNDLHTEGKRVVRGGSFSDRPKRCTASYRLGYQPWQGVYNVGFRVVMREQK